MRRTLQAAALAATLLSTLGLAARAAEAQTTTPRVRVEEFTVDGDPPPAQYRDLLANAIQPTIGAVERCYDQRLALNPALGGDYRLRLWVSARQVIRTTPESSVGDTVLEVCARAALRTFTLPPQAPEGGATGRFVGRFPPPPPGSGPPPAPPATAPLITPLPMAPPRPAEITNPRIVVRIESIRGALAAPSLQTTFPALGFEGCANGMTGELPVSVSINARGQISARAGRGTLRDRNVSRCVVQQVEALSAPASEGRTRMRVVFVFVR